MVVVAASAAPLPVALHGTETVLLVEDELLVLKLGRRVLQKHGYHVLAASAPDEARTIGQEYDGPIHLLLSDVVMPGMNGKQLWAELLASRPGIKCLFMSGYTSDVIAHEGVLDAGLNFIQKPFALDALVCKVRETLDAPPTT